jgi:hypothetical protein
MARSPLGVHIGGIDEVSTVIGIETQYCFRVLLICAIAKDIATEAEL